jgi:mitotic-spindle organizing protein 1
VNSFLIIIALVLHEISNVLKTGLDKESLEICTKMLEQGVNPEALAAVIKELRRESKAITEKSS